MGVKALLAFVLVFMVVSFALGSEAFMGGGGIGKIQSKRENEVSFENKCLFPWCFLEGFVRIETHVHEFHCY